MNRTKIEDFIEELKSLSNRYHEGYVIHKHELDELIERHSTSLLAEDEGEVAESSYGKYVFVKSSLGYILMWKNNDDTLFPIDNEGVIEAVGERINSHKAPSQPQKGDSK